MKSILSLSAGLWFLFPLLYSKPCWGQQIAAGDAHTCVVTDMGGVRCWGSNKSGQAPEKIDLGGAKATMVSAAANSTCAVTDQGIYCWGHGYSGASPIKILFDNHDIKVSNISQIALSGSGGCALVDGSVYCWRIFSHFSAQLKWLHPIYNYDEKIKFSQISASLNHTCALADKGVYCWGPSVSEIPHSFIDFGGVQISQIEVGLYNCCALTKNGMLCSSVHREASTPYTFDVSEFAQAKIIQMQRLNYHSCAITEQGVLCRSSGVPVNDKAEAPSRVDLGGARVFSMATGYEHSCASTDQGVRCWGRNDAGQAPKNVAIGGAKVLGQGSLKSFFVREGLKGLIKEIKGERQLRVALDKIRQNMWRMEISEINDLAPFIERLMSVELEKPLSSEESFSILNHYEKLMPLFQAIAFVENYSGVEGLVASSNKYVENIIAKSPGVIDRYLLSKLLSYYGIRSEKLSKEFQQITVEQKQAFRRALSDFNDRLTEEEMADVHSFLKKTLQLKHIYSFHNLLINEEALVLRDQEEIASTTVSAKKNKDHQNIEETYRALHLPVKTKDQQILQLAKKIVLLMKIRNVL